MYCLIERAAVARGYTSVDLTMQWPGHERSGVLTLSGAMDVARKKIEEIEATAEGYDFLARSFGCYVALKTALDRNPKGLRKIILWGPPPYWLMWEMWTRDLDANRAVAAEKGLAVDRSLFPGLVPLECLLPMMRYDTVVATGDQDPYVSHAYLRYLETLVRERRSSKYCQSIRFKDAVPGAVHEVTEDAPEPVRDAYVAALFE